MRRAANHLYENEPKAQNAFDSFLNPYDIVRGSEPFERQELHGFRLGEVAAVEQVGAHRADVLAVEVAQLLDVKYRGGLGDAAEFKDLLQLVK